MVHLAGTTVCGEMFTKKNVGKVLKLATFTNGKSGNTNCPVGRKCANVA